MELNLGYALGYVGVPAPDYLEYDPWFGHPILSETQLSLKAAKERAIEDKQLTSEPESVKVESSDIHERMYRIATKSGATTTQLDPMPELGGGSEQYQTGPGGWSSGNGMNQFR
jgi:hypothetical protein